MIRPGLRPWEGALRPHWHAQHLPSGHEGGRCSGKCEGADTQYSRRVPSQLAAVCFVSSPPSAIATEHRCQPPIPALYAENCSQLKADKSQSNPADGKGQWYAGRDRNNKPDHLTARGNRSCSASLTVVGRLDEEFQGHANSCRSGSGPFGACALPDVFELWWPSVFTPVLGRCSSREAASSALQTCSFG
jgi:hypothetical protein